MRHGLDRRAFMKGAAAAILPAPALGGGRGDDLLEQLYLAEVRDDPYRASQLGIRTADGRPWRTWTIRDEKWQQRSISSALAAMAQVRQADDLAAFDRELYLYLQQDRLERARRSGNDYVFYSSTLPPAVGMSALISWQPAGNVAEMDAYLARAAALAGWIAADASRFRRRAESGIAPPAFNFPLMDAACARMIDQLADAPSHPLVADLSAKARRAGISAAGVARSRTALEAILADVLRPAIRELRQMLRRVAASATANRGVWSLPDGEAHYASLVRHHTTLDLDPDELHGYGMDEVKRLRSELRQLAPKLGLPSDEALVLRSLASDARFFLLNTPEGRRIYLDRASAAIAAATGKTSAMVGLPLQAALEMREVDPVSAPAAGRAHYVEPRADGAPGIFYLNTHDMRQNPAYQLEAVVYHEAIPGHHLQAAVQAGAEMPLYRRQLYVGAYAEGWGLYAEKMADEFGLYSDAQAQAGRIALELFRAARLVVDTGIHARRWTYDRAIRFMDENTANAPADNRKEVERYFNWPGQALAYKAGMRHIERLRAECERAEGGAFDIRRFHDRILKAGSRPLSML